MKPITDDVVHSLLQGIAEREKKRPRKGGTQTTPAKIIRFTGKAVTDGKITLETDGGRRTISGLFCYVSRLSS